MADVPNLNLNNGQTIPQLGFGVFQIDPADKKPWRARSKHTIQAHSMVVLSTSVVPEAERAASESRAIKALTRTAKQH